jgi:hypothetical protein
MDESAVRELLHLAAQDEGAPPCEVSVRLARRQGGQQRRLLHVYLPGAAPVAAAVAVALVLTLSASLRGGSAGGSEHDRSKPAAPAPIVAPRSFNPLVPYASFGWLPAGFSDTGAASASDESTAASVTLQALASATDGRMVEVTVDARDSCRIEPTSKAMPKAALSGLTSGTASITATPAQTLSCTDPSSGGLGNRVAELASAAPDVNGEPAYWTPEGALVWQYAPGAWAEVMPMVNPMYCVSAVRAGAACAGGNVAGWTNVSGAAAAAAVGRSRAAATKQALVQPQVQSAASKALLLQIAANLQYGDTTPLVFGFELAGLPAGWQVADDYYFAPQAGRLAASGLSAGPEVDPTALGISVGPAVSPTSQYACKFVPGQSSSVTVDGEPALFRYLNEPDKQWQSLCANDIDGLSPYVELDLNVPGSSAPLPGGTEVSSVLTLFQSVRLLGPNPAAWLTDPLG